MPHLLQTTFLFLFCITVLSPEVRATEKIEFEWALLLDTEAGQVALDFTSIPKLQTGSTLQTYLKPVTPAFLYLFLLDSDGRFSPVFPQKSNYYDRLRRGKPVLIPEGEDRFSLIPPAGQERFILLASSKRLTTIEKLIDECMSSPKDIERHAELYRHVRIERRKHSTLSQFTEKGTPVSGTWHDLRKTRGSPDESAFMATLTVADTFYSKILRIDHE